MITSEEELGQKYIIQQELEDEIEDAKFRLDITNYDIGNLKDAIITEYKEVLEEKQELIDNLKGAKK